ncbi:MAG: hypothetical protein JKY37_01400 [Nannocystaceae bacterium]|nr:hypothetical protein [Nannocystaceae bacterium]
MSRPPTPLGRAKLVLPLVSLLLALLGPACKRDDFVRATVHKAHGLATAITRVVSGATDKRAGVAEAQARLDAERTALEHDILELKSLRSYQMTATLQPQWRDAFIDDLAAIESLQSELRVEMAADPTLAAAVDTLVRDYAAIVSITPPPEA